MKTNNRRRIAVIGGGPVGLEAAAAAVRLGFETTVFERGEIARHVSQWGHVKLFTHFGMNAGPEGRRLVTELGGSLPGDDDFLTGGGFRDRFLVPLGAVLGKSACVRTQCRVIAVGRNHLLKGEDIGDSVRADDGFRILFEHEGAEHVTEADVVLDCTGTYGSPSWLGPGGNAAVGERRLRDAVEYGLPDILGSDRDTYAGKHTLLVGDGLSAATSVLLLAELGDKHPGSTFHWATRGEKRRPVEPIPGDELSARRDLTSRANALAGDPPPGCTWECDVHVASIERSGDDGPFSVALSNGSGTRTESFDRIIANVGFEPDDSIYRQLQIHECYASRGPMKLSAALMAASGDGPADCLSLGGFGPDALMNPEPNYFILGMKSYGKSSAFLLRTGYEQVRDVFALLGGTGR